MPMRTLNSPELAQVTGAKTALAIDVNTVEHYVHLNLVTDTKVITLLAIDWTRWMKAGTPAA